MMNQTLMMEFLLIRFADNWMLLKLHAVLFSLIYTVAVLENLIILILTVVDQCLHTPMYFFLRHLSFLDLCLISATVPKSILNSITFTDSISFLVCVFQLFLVVLLAGSEIGILTAMSYDHYVAICHPLHYEAVMSRGSCVQLMAVSWLSGGVLGILYSAGTFSLNFCGSNKIYRFFCDVPAILKLTCSKEHATINVSVAVGVCYAFSCLVCITVSYVYIFSTVLKKLSGPSQFKAFSTCVPHFIVVSTFLVTGGVAYLKLGSDVSSILDLVMSVFYSVAPPALNPVIYCLRNKVKSVLRKVLYNLKSSKNPPKHAAATLTRTDALVTDDVTGQRAAEGNAALTERGSEDESLRPRKGPKDTPQEPRDGYHLHTDSPDHDDSIVQRVRDGHRAVIGHGREDAKLSGGKVVVQVRQLLDEGRQLVLGHAQVPRVSLATWLAFLSTFPLRAAAGILAASAAGRPCLVGAGSCLDRPVPHLVSAAQRPQLWLRGHSCLGHSHVVLAGECLSAVDVAILMAVAVLPPGRGAGSQGAAVPGEAAPAARRPRRPWRCCSCFRCPAASRAARASRPPHRLWLQPLEPRDWSSPSTGH
ncbi:PREDICTED: olfactory receptor 14K1-like [Propithecus coquereli]|uniref:olfactory receptor 14K1-like n=1 Tax=Propithecus coquereli TaxID=379532 RepID=UPI00063EED39|nr:PREDICTED: olfactory receptor 14K1-like [Propithecus coquereli]